MSTRWRRSDGVVTRRIAGETLLVPVRGALADLERIFTLNDTGAAAWELLDGQLTLEAIGERMAEQFDVGADEARDDAARLVGQLREAGLVEPACPGEDAA